MSRSLIPDSDHSNFENKNLSFKQFEEDIYDMYLEIKIKILNGEILIIDDEKEKLKDLKLTTIIKYLKENLSILINLKSEEAVRKFEKELKSKLTENEEDILRNQSEYEKILCKLEAEIRSHIKNEYQMKLHNEFLESKLQDYEEMASVFEDLQNKVEKYEKKISIDDYAHATDKKQNEIIILKAENSNLKNIVKSFEDKIKYLCDLEIKYDNLKRVYDVEMQTYNHTVEKLNKKLSSYEKIVKNNNSNNLIKNKNTNFVSRDSIDLKEKSIEFKSNEFNRINVKRSASSGSTHQEFRKRVNLNKSDFTRDSKENDIKDSETFSIAKTHRKITSTHNIKILDNEIKDNSGVLSIINNNNNQKNNNNQNNSLPITKLKIPVNSNFIVMNSQKIKNPQNLANINIISNTSRNDKNDKKFQNSVLINSKILNMSRTHSGNKKLLNLNKNTGGTPNSINNTNNSNKTTLNLNNLKNYMHNNKSNKLMNKHTPTSVNVKSTAISPY